MPKLPIWSGVLAVAAAGSCLVATATFSLQAQDIAPPPGGDSAPGEQNYEALTRGPMHEAFANPYVADPQPGLVVEQQPPEPIDEIPPDSMPEGENVAWIPGYWGWDPDASEFIWISGLWRNMPAEHRWVPGYWAKIEGGYQWIAGFWSDSQTEELAYLPEPPQSLEQGPNVAPPEGDYFWIPGCWTWQDVSYDWRPGYWAPAVADWVWIPDQYMWTPYGCVFVPGYWDYTFVDRGVMFAPVHFETAVYQQPSFQYVPTVVIDTAPLMLHLFVSPNYGHYYYGDYYAFQPAQSGFGFYPWAAYGNRRSFYDPMLTYYQWSYGQRDINIVQRLTVWNQYFVRNEAYRPPRTFTAQRQFLNRIDRENLPLQGTALAFASPLQEFAQQRSDRFRFQTVAEPRRQRFAESSRELRAFQRQRSEFEVAAIAETGDAPAARTQPGEDRRRGEGRRREKTLQVPEATNIAAETPPQDTPATDQATEPRQTPDAGQAEDGRPSPGRRQPPPERPRPDRQPPRGEGRGQTPGDQPQTPNQPGQPGESPEGRPGDRPRPGRPDLTRPTDGQPDRPNEPGRPDQPQPGQPGQPNQPEGTQNLPGDRPDPRRPGAERDGEAGPDLPRPDRRGPDAETRPDAPDNQRPQFPRFGVGRNRPQTSDESTAPAQPGPGGERGRRPEDGRQRAPRGFDPFGGLPPGAENDDARGRNAGAAPGQPGRSGPPDERRDPQSRRPTPSQPGAGPQSQPGQPPAINAERPSRGRRGGEARPDRPAGSPPGGPPQAGPPRGGQPPQAAPQAPKGGGPPQSENRGGRGKGQGNDRQGNSGRKDK